MCCCCELQNWFLVPKKNELRRKKGPGPILTTSSLWVHLRCEVYGRDHMRCKQVPRCCFSATELCLTCDSLRRLCLPVCWFAELREKKKKNIDNKLEHRPFLWSRNSVQYLLEGLIGMSCILWTMVVCVFLTILLFGLISGLLVPFIL